MIPSRSKVIALMLLLTGCTATEPALKSPYSAVLFSTDFPITSADTGTWQGLVKTQCIEKVSAPGNFTRLFQAWFTASESMQTVDHSECVYIGVDVSRVMVSSITDQQRDQLISFLLSISDQNCAWFRSRVFANKAGIDTSAKWLKDLATAASAATAFPFPAAAVGIGVANLIVGNAVSDINSTYFYDKTFQAMDSAISAGRQTVRSQILAKQTASKPGEKSVPYTVNDALGDVRNYDSICSIQGGLSQLAAIAQQAAATPTASKPPEEPTPAVPKPGVPKPAVPKPAVPKPAVPKPAVPKPAVPPTVAP